MKLNIYIGNDNIQFMLKIHGNDVEPVTSCDTRTIFKKHEFARCIAFNMIHKHCVVVINGNINNGSLTILKLILTIAYNKTNVDLKHSTFNVFVNKLSFKLP